jgi:hypothetical protein
MTGRSGTDLGFQAAMVGAVSRLRVVDDAGEQPPQLDRGRQLTALPEDGADRRSLPSVLKNTRLESPVSATASAAGCNSERRRRCMSSL